MIDAYDIFAIAGLLLVAIGFAMLNLALGVIVLGAEMATVGILAAMARSKKGART